MKLIKKANKKEAIGGKATQNTMLKLKEIYKKEVVYMPYGREGKGFYISLTQEVER